MSINSTSSGTKQQEKQSASVPLQVTERFQSAPSNPSQTEEATESVHLQLRDRWSSPEETKEVNDEKPCTASSSVLINDTVIPPIEICEFREVQTGQIMLALHGWNQSKAEIFSQHLYGQNFSQFPLLYQYHERSIDRNDSKSYEEYLALWKQSKFLTQKKSLEDDWKRESLSPSGSSGTGGRRNPSVEMVMTQNLSKMQLIAQEYEATLEELRRFLTETVREIQGHDISYYHFHHHHHPQQEQTERSFSEQLAILKNFSVWFRQEFPYYYDRCVHCDQSSSSSQGPNEYFGSVYANPEEKQYHAGKTELYLCGQCVTISRFPRFNDMRKVIQTKRGRCGEYSVLMMLFLQALGYTARYVVDREDHAWTEVYLKDQWIHLDPCEAAINEPLIYQGWGKNQTFILALDLLTSEVEDVTTHYTSEVEAIYARREAEGVTVSSFQTFLEQSRQSFHQLLKRQHPDPSSTPSTRP